MEAKIPHTLSKGRAQDLLWRIEEGWQRDEKELEKLKQNLIKLISEHAEHETAKLLREYLFWRCVKEVDQTWWIACVSMPADLCSFTNL